MKNCLHLILVCTAALWLAACTDNNGQLPAGEDSPATLHVSIAPMQLMGEQVPYDTRASEPMAPEYENSIYSLAVLVFNDREGMLMPFPAVGLQQPKYYRYIGLTDANGNGVLNTTLSAADLPTMEVEDNYTVCLIANLPEAQVDAIVSDMLNSGNGAAFLWEFQEQTVAIPYVDGDMAAGSNLQIGHVQSIYMFGYYQGSFSSLQSYDNQLSITLGRIISRLEMAFTVDASLLEEGKTFYCRMNKLETHARLFPTGKSPGEVVPGAISELSSLNTGSSTIYFYAAPHSAETEDEAMSLDLWYANEGLTGDALQALGETEANATIQLCNDQPGVDNRNFYLNRNSVYRFNFNLVRKSGASDDGGNTSTRTSSTPGVYEVVLEGLDE